MITLLQLDWSLIALLFATMILAGLVHGALGLGFPMVATPIVAIFLDVRSAILLTLLPTVVVNIASIVGTANYVDNVRRHGLLVVMALIGSLLGAYVLAIADPNPFRLVLALLIGLFLWTSHSNKVPREWFKAHVPLAMVLFGLLSGFSAGTTNVMVAVLIIFFIAMETPRPTMVPVMNTCFMIGKLSQILILSVAGFISATLLVETIPLAAAGLGALLVGQRLRDRIPVATYRRLLHILLAGLAVTLIVQFSQST
jgi:uncharacterized protein